LANIIKDFQKQIQSVPISKPKMEEVPSAMIQPKNKEFFKSDKSQGSAPKNQTNSNNAANKNQTNNTTPQTRIKPTTATPQTRTKPTTATPQTRTKPTILRANKCPRKIRRFSTNKWANRPV
jgi:hypothetical protein